MMEDEDNWGLQAVVRSCGGAAAASCSSASSSCSSSFTSAAGWSITAPFLGLLPLNPPFVKEVGAGVSGDRHLDGLCSAAANDLDSLGELEGLFRPFFHRPAAATDPTKPLPLAEEGKEDTRSVPPVLAPFCTSVIGGVGGGNQLPAGKQPLLSRQQPRPRGMCQAVSNARSRRRKNLVKKVVRQVPADALCSDMWAWRKYGQKPIKGSPFPRGYYRCSSSKGCPARKQVERSRTDPGMFVITYTSEHNHPVPTHRSCLAGSTRHKSPPPPLTPLLPMAPSSSEDPAAAATACGNQTTSCGSGLKPSVSYSPLSSVEDELLLPVPEQVAAPGMVRGGLGTGRDNGAVLDSDGDEDGFLLVSAMEMENDMLDGVEEDDDEGYGEEDDGMLLFSTVGICCSSPPPPPPPPPCLPPTAGPAEGGVVVVCSSWRDDHGTARLPFAAASR